MLVLYCKLYLAPCLPNPCRNGGMCIPGIRGSYSCNCQIGYVGTRCEMNGKQLLLKIVHLLG